MLCVFTRTSHLLLFPWCFTGWNGAWGAVDGDVLVALHVTKWLLCATPLSTATPHLRCTLHAPRLPRRYLVIDRLTVQNLLYAGVAVLSTLLVFQPPLSALLVLLVVAMVDIDILGLMVIWDIRLNVASVVNLVMAVSDAGPKEPRCLGKTGNMALVHAPVGSGDLVSTAGVCAFMALLARCVPPLHCGKRSAVLTCASLPPSLTSARTCPPLPPDRILSGLCCTCSGGFRACQG